jgi:hypothetical protein
VDCRVGNSTFNLKWSIPRKELELVAWRSISRYQKNLCARLFSLLLLGVSSYWFSRFPDGFRELDPNLIQGFRFIGLRQDIGDGFERVEVFSFRHFLSSTHFCLPSEVSFFYYIFLSCLLY